VSLRLPRVPGLAVVRALRRAGFELVRVRGDHAKLVHPVTGRIAIVPLHRELATGTLASVLRQAGLDADDLQRLL
jgi:predicted RNA binding protein YcfA (HicA-like mRNA interferase family)